MNELKGKIEQIQRERSRIAGLQELCLQGSIQLSCGARVRSLTGEELKPVVAAIEQVVSAAKDKIKADEDLLEGFNRVIAVVNEAGRQAIEQAGADK